MIKLLRKENIIISILIFGFVLWVGGICSKLLVSSEMLAGKTFAFAPPESLSAERMLYSLITRSTIIYLIGFIVTILSAVLIIVNKKYSFKKEGWLLISVLLFLIFIPIEVFTIWIDLQFILAEMTQNMDMNILRRLFVHRVHALAGAPYMALMAYAAILFIIIFKPLRKN